MGPLIGALNPWQIVMELRRQGFAGVIVTTYEEVVDRDGKRCRRGLYAIAPEHKPLVEEVLKKEATGPENPKPMAAGNSRDDSTGGEQ
jgi:hypothetical protein